MKTFFKLFTITFFALLLFTSCQNEVLEETPIDNEEELIVPNSALSNLLFSTAARNGSIDNILDDANCMSVNLPVTVIVNDITITINTLEDLELIEDIFNEFETDEDVLELLFPITIILNDYEEVVINNQDELDAFVEDCVDETDDDIECIDFQYPISFSIYDTDFQVIETVIVENDSQLHDFLERIEESDGGALLVSLNFPVEMVYANGETVTVNNNTELATVLNDAREDCSEEEACREEVVNMYLQECYWNIVAYNNSNDLIDYDLYFNEDNQFKVIHEGTILATGRWNTTLTDRGVVVSISELTALVEIVGGDWLIVECDSDRFELIQEDAASGDITHIVLEQECEDDLECSALDVRMFLNQCQWFAGSNLPDGVPAGAFHFLEDNVLLVVNQELNEEITGFWDVELTDEGIILVIDLPNPYEAISLRWKITECADYRVKMINDEGDYLVFERDCNSEEDLLETIVECKWSVGSLTVDGANVTDDYNDLLLNFYENGFVVAEVGEEVIKYGSFEIDETADEQLVVLLSIFGFGSDLNDYYIVQSISDEEIVFTASNKELILHRTCDNINEDGDVNQIKNWLYEGDWEMAYFTLESVDETSDFDNIVFDFQPEANLLGINNTTSQTNNLHWEVLRDQNNNLRFVINYLGIFPYWQMDDDWYITEVDSNRIELHHINDDSNNEFVMVFEKQ